MVLKDGSVFEGKGFGATKKVSGEVVFNTGMVGYPESITDPSYWGQILVQTYPLIGNYGIFPGDFESDSPKIWGYVISSLCRRPSHHSCEKTLDRWLKESGVPGIEGVDTRMLTKKLREKGSMLGVLEVSENDIDIDKLKQEAKKAEDPNNRDLTKEVTRDSIKTYGKGKSIVALIDCGTKRSIIDCLVRAGAKVVAFPVDTPFERIIEHRPDGILISNGPGDPKKCRAVKAVSDAMDYGIPVMGICMGNQILGLAAGADTYKLKFGHRSQNQPCVEAGTQRCYITSQNHGYAIRSDTLPDGWREWFVNINDGSNEGIIHKRKPFMSVQFHPEASPGPVDTAFLFRKFMKTIEASR